MKRAGVEEALSVLLEALARNIGFPQTLESEVPDCNNEVSGAGTSLFGMGAPEKPNSSGLVFAGRQGSFVRKPSCVYCPARRIACVYVCMSAICMYQCMHVCMQVGI